MPNALSLDLRKRVLDALAAGMSQRAAAARFAVSLNTITNWLNLLREQGHLNPRPYGYARPLAMDAARDFLLGLVKKDPGLSIAELRDRLADEKGIVASWSAVQSFLKRYGVERKPGARPGRRRMRPPEQRPVWPVPNGRR